MPLFSTIDFVKRYIPVSFANANNSIPKMQRVAEDEYIKPVLGIDLFIIMQTEANNMVPRPNYEPPENPTELLDKVWMALAYLMYFKEMPFIHTLITDAGLRGVTNDKMQGAYRYQYEDIMQHCEDEGLAALERLFQFLYDMNIITYGQDTLYQYWATSDAYKRLNRNLIKTGLEFTGYYHLHHPHRTFYVLQPIMQEVEDLFIIPLIGQEFFTELKDNLTPNDDEKMVILYLKKAISNYTINKSISKLSMKVLPEGITAVLSHSATDRAAQGEVNAPEKQLDMLHHDTSQDGNAYLGKAMAYLNSKASGSVFATYYASSYYTNPATEVKDINSGMTGIYAM